jgi:hypothetical protein
LFYSFPVSDFGRSFWVYLRLLQSLCRLFNWPDRDALLNSKTLYNEMHNLPVVRAVEGCFSGGLPVLPAGVIEPAATAETSGYPCLVESLF